MGAVYLVIGRVFTWPAGHVQAWRLAAWLVSGVVYAAHIAYELRQRHPPRTTALHVAIAVAVGSVAIAVAGFIQTIATGGMIGARWLIALFVFPAFTGIPAFVVALAIGAALARLARARVDH